MPALDIFSSDAFSMLSLTDAINKMPFVPGQAGALGIFQETGIPTTIAMLEEREGYLTLIPTVPRGGAPNVQAHNLRNARAVEIPHIPLEGRVNAAEVQDIRAFGQESQLQTVQGIVGERLAEASQSFDATLEHLRIGAIKGTVVDADGSTVLLNTHTFFNVAAQADVDFDLDNATPASGAVRKACHSVIRTIEDELGQASYDHIHAFVGAAFMDDLVSHQETLTAYDRWNQGEALRMSFARRTFAYAGILFEEYRGTVNGVQFVGDNDAWLFPVGVPGLFRTYFAPADFAETVNTMGLPRYARQAPDERFNRWVDLHMQTNPLSICTRPRALVKGDRT